MMNNKKEEIVLKAVPTVVITKNLKDQIDFLHKKVGSVEWSGVLFFEKIGDFEPNLEKLNSLKFICKHIHLCDIGNATFTSYTIDNTLFDVYDEYPELDPTLNSNNKYGQIHTHHNMQSFFSGTDMDHLHQLSEDHNYILSLIVNFKEEYCAKIGIKGKIKKQYTSFFSSEDSEETEVLYILNCKIEFEENIKESFIKRFNEINKPKPVYVNNYYQSNFDFDYNSYDPNNIIGEGTDIKNKNINIMLVEADVRKFLISLLSHGQYTTNDTLSSIVFDLDDKLKKNTLNLSSFEYKTISYFENIFQNHFDTENKNQVLSKAIEILKRYTNAEVISEIIPVLEALKDVKTKNNIISSSSPKIGGFLKKIKHKKR